MELYLALADYLERHSLWDVKQVAITALSLFLLQQGEVEQAVSRLYLDSVLRHLDDTTSCAPDTGNTDPLTN